jgi:hypothetical protein
MYCNNAIFETAAVLFTQECISEEDFLLVYELTRRKSPEFPYWQYEHIDVQLQQMNDDECLSEFRVNLSELYTLADVLRIPEHFHCPNGTLATGLEGLCVVLKRFAYPCRFSDMMYRFGRSVPELSLIASEVTDFVYENHGYLLRTLDQPWLALECLEDFANAIHNRGAPLTNCWGFVDGTVRPMCRPGQHQRVVYNGHKRVHALKFQSVVAPNGLIANLYGPVGKVNCIIILLNLLLTIINY